MRIRTGLFGLSLGLLVNGENTYSLKHFKDDNTIRPFHAPNLCVSGPNKKGYIKLEECKDLPKQKWTFNSETGNVVSPTRGTCLEYSVKKLRAAACDPQQQKQVFTFDMGLLKYKNLCAMADSEKKIKFKKCKFSFYGSLVTENETVHNEMTCETVQEMCSDGQTAPATEAIDVAYLVDISKQSITTENDVENAENFVFDTNDMLPEAFQRFYLSIHMFGTQTNDSNPCIVGTGVSGMAEPAALEEHVFGPIYDYYNHQLYELSMDYCDTADIDANFNKYLDAMIARKTAVRRQAILLVVGEQVTVSAESVQRGIDAGIEIYGVKIGGEWQVPSTKSRRSTDVVNFPPKVPFTQTFSAASYSDLPAVAPAAASAMAQPRSACTSNCETDSQFCVSYGALYPEVLGSMCGSTNGVWSYTAATNGDFCQYLVGDYASLCNSYQSCKLDNGACNVVAASSDGKDPTVYTLNADGSGNAKGYSAPPMEFAVGLSTTPSEDGKITLDGIPSDPHGVHNIITADGTGYIAGGVGGEDELRPDDLDGWVVRANRCPSPTQYSASTGVKLDTTGTDCSKNYKWVARLGTQFNWDSVNGVVESNDGRYIYAIGVIATSAKPENAQSRMIWKLDAQTGAQVWELKLPTDTGVTKFNGYEAAKFTKDGGLVLCGYTLHSSVTHSLLPGFKSGGQVEGGLPMVEKIAASTMDLTSQAEIDALTKTIAGGAVAWRYVLDFAESKVEETDSNGYLRQGGMKNLRIIDTVSGEQVVATGGVRASVYRFNADTGALLSKAHLGDKAGQCADVEPILDSAGEFNGYALAGHTFTPIAGGTEGLTPNGGAKEIQGVLHTYDRNNVLVSTTAWNNFPGGKYQFAGLTPGLKSVIKTECWGLGKTTDASGKHDGYAVACGTGIEPGSCTDENYTTATQNSCNADPRIVWRALVMRLDLQGNKLWHVQDNFYIHDPTGQETGVGTGASEYLSVVGNNIVSLTDEGFGFAFYSYQDGA